jgi:DNA-binding Lrp family transcriptional regulator
MWQAQVWVKWNENAPHDGTWNWLKDWKEVHTAWSVMGDWDMLLTIEAKTPEDVENFIWNKLRKKNWVSATHTTWANQVWENPKWSWKKPA